MTAAEADFLHDLLSCVAGHQTKSRRKHAINISLKMAARNARYNHFGALNSADIDSECAEVFFLTTANDTDA